MSRGNVVRAADVAEGALLGEGGQGRVTEVLAIGGLPVRDLVIKRYHDGIAINPASLTRLVALRRSMSSVDAAALDAVACWPRAVLVSGDRAVGALLPRVPADFTFDLRMPGGGSTATLRELQFLIADAALLRRRGIEDPDTVTRLRVLAHCTEVAAMLHRHGVVLGDLSVKNVLWRAEPEPAVYLVDCDGVRLGGADPVSPQPNSPGWDDPLFPGTQNQQSDVYKSALVVLRAVARNFHTRDPEGAAEVLGRGLMPLLRASLRAEPGSRPPISAWPEPLLRRAAELRTPTRPEGVTTR
ncbi:phosphotransferase [Lentzea sp. BCCO 10_0798]|uniref:Phosphotransferase n=1 Tax=Lentzea kristufekii TaxID=3095430 RepID=A0ABU4TP50_9PSEU|nr:phosphotransferase [Lentzea sp. BCCO 10_0798]MDX8049636.1 phosphotransferase [Lentzea sp. BCCO 10_0798]